MVALQETKMESVNGRFVKFLWGNRACVWAHHPSYRASGGLLTIWDTRYLELVDFLEGGFSLNICFRNVNDNHTWMHSNIYGPVDIVSKQDF